MFILWLHVPVDFYYNCTWSLGHTYTGFKDSPANNYCFCVFLLCTQFMSPCHATSCIERACCWRNVDIYMALEGIWISMHRFNSLKCFGDHRFSFDISLVEGWFFFNFSAHASLNSAITLTAQCWQKPILQVSSTERMTLVQIMYLTDPLFQSEIRLRKWVYSASLLIFFS